MNSSQNEKSPDCDSDNLAISDSPVQPERIRIHWRTRGLQSWWRKMHLPTDNEEKDRNPEKERIQDQVGAACSETIAEETRNNHCSQDSRNRVPMRMGYT